MEKVLKNVEIANYVVAELKKEGFEVKYSKVLDTVDCGRDEEEEEKMFAEDKIQQLKEDYKDGFLEEAAYQRDEE